MAAITTNPPASELTTEKDLSVLYRVLRTVIKPLRPRLTQPGKPLPAGSPRLSKHPESKKGCSIVERQDENTGLWLYQFKPQTFTATENTKDITPKHKVFYFAGGGWQSPPAGEHWSFVATLASHAELSSIYDFVLVSYPLAPNSPAAESLPVLRRFLRQAIEDAAATNTKVSLMGDSSGGNITLSLGFWWVDQLGHLPPEISLSSPSDDDEQAPAATTSTSTTAAGAPSGGVVGSDSNKKNSVELGGGGGGGGKLSTEAHKQHRHTTSSLLNSNATNLATVLSNLIVISPAVDLTNSNPQLKTTDTSDPVLGSDLTSLCAKAWTSSSPTSASRKLPATDPTVSPLLFKSLAFSALAAAGMKVHGVIGTHDVLAPDTELFRRKCVESGVSGEWLVWEGQMHCFPLAGMYGMREGRRATEWMVGVLGRNA